MFSVNELDYFALPVYGICKAMFLQGISNESLMHGLSCSRERRQDQDSWLLDLTCYKLLSYQIHTYRENTKSVG